MDWLNGSGCARDLWQIGMRYTDALDATAYSRTWLRTWIRRTTHQHGHEHEHVRMHVLKYPPAAITMRSCTWWWKDRRCLHPNTQPQRAVILRACALQLRACHELRRVYTEDGITSRRACARTCVAQCASHTTAYNDTSRVHLGLCALCCIFRV